MIKSTRSKYTIFPIVLLLIFLGLSQCKTSQQSQAEAIQPTTNSLIWRVSGNGLKQASWVYGTIHMIPADKFFLPEGTEEAFDTAEVLYLEVDLTEIEDPARQMQLFQQSFMKGEQTLKDLVSDEDYTLIKTHFADMGLPLMFLEKIKPMFLTVFADGSLDPNSLNDGSVKVYEMEFTDMAKNASIPIRGLESIDYQMAIMDSIPYDVQADMLVESIRLSDEGTSQLDTLVDIYISQDIEAMYASFDEDDLSVYDSLLLIQRNHNWIPVMETSMKDSSCFFAVGAGHLGGPDGVIALLRREGYRVVAVR